MGHPARNPSGIGMKKQPRFQPYKAKDGWRWRLIAANGRIIADSGEAYARKSGVERAITTTIAAVGTIEQWRVVERLQASAASATRRITSRFIGGATDDDSPGHA